MSEKSENQGITVLVPAFKSKYLSRLLDSLCLQSDKDFLVVICDDASSEPVYEVSSRYFDRLKIKYKRFDSNLGGADLAAQWNRCLDEVTSDWVIMPGDDDTLDRDCIFWFRKAILETGGRFAAYQATLRGIDEEDGERYKFPAISSSNSSQRLSSIFSPGFRGMVIEIMFSKVRIQELGGFISFPLGWYSDWATWVALAGRGGIFAVPDAIVNHRMSALNISSANPSLRRAKFNATIKFWQWIHRNKCNLRIEGEQYSRYSRVLSGRARNELIHLDSFVFISELNNRLGLIAELSKISRARVLINSILRFIWVRVKWRFIFVPKY